MHSLKGIGPEAPAHVSVRLWAAYGGDGGAQSRASTAASTQACDAFDGARLLMDFVQELVSNVGHMAPVMRKCKTCGEYKPFKDYDGSQWQKDHKKRQCNKCKPPNQAQTVAAATGTHAPTPVEQHGALGGQSAAAGITAAAGAHAGSQTAAGDEGAPSKRPRDGDSAAAGHAGQRCALPSCDEMA